MDEIKRGNLYIADLDPVKGSEQGGRRPVLVVQNDAGNQHSPRSTFCTMLLKNDFNPKAVSKLMGHSKEIITMDVYGDNKGIIADGVPEIQAYMDEVLPKKEQREEFEDELLNIVVDVSEYICVEKMRIYVRFYLYILKSIW